MRRVSRNDSTCDPVSPTFGYTLSWDKNWVVESSSSADGYDLLELTNGTSNVYLQGYVGYGGDAQDCIEGVAGALRADPAFEDLEPATSGNGDPLAGGDETSAFAVYRYTYAFEDQDVELLQYVECQTVVPGEAVVIVGHTVTPDAYNDEIPSRRELLDTLELPEP